jgi:hypothetical protein
MRRIRYLLRRTTRDLSWILQMDLFLSQSKDSDKVEVLLTILERVELVILFQVKVLDSIHIEWQEEA